MLKQLKWIVFMSFPLFLWGCEMDEDLKAVRDFADTASSGTEIFTAISDDFYGSCLRKARHPNLNLTFSAQEFEDLVDRSTVSVNNDVEFNPSPNKNNLSSPATDTNSKLKSFANLRKIKEEECQHIFGDSATQLDELNQIVADYIQKLGELANGEATNYSNNLQQLENAIANLDRSFNISTDPKLAFLSENQIGSAKSIVGFLIETNNRDFQKEQLIEVISESDDDLQKIIGGLSSITARDYISMLDSEQQQLNSYYQDSILRELFRLEQAKSESGNRDNLPLIAILVDSQWRVEKSKIDELRKLADNYVRVITEIGKAHNDLKNYLQDPTVAFTPEQVDRLIDKRTRAIKPLVNEAIQIARQLSGDEYGNSNRR